MKRSDGRQVDQILFQVFVSFLSNQKEKNKLLVPREKLRLLLVLVWDEGHDAIVLHFKHAVTRSWEVMFTEKSFTRLWTWSLIFSPKFQKFYLVIAQQCRSVTAVQMCYCCNIWWPWHWDVTHNPASCFSFKIYKSQVPLYKQASACYFLKVSSYWISNRSFIQSRIFSHEAGLQSSSRLIFKLGSSNLLPLHDRGGAPVTCIPSPWRPDRRQLWVSGC